MRKIISVIIALMSISPVLCADSFKENVLACDGGNAEACYDAGDTYSAQAYKEKNYNSATAASKVASFYRNSCDLGYAQGCTAYGISYAADNNKDNQKDARYYFQKGCDGGDETGCNLLKFSPLN